MAEGSHSLFEVKWSQAVRDQLIEIHRQAVLEGAGEGVLSAARTLVEGLQSDPLGMGELLYRLRGLRLEVRLGVVKPLAVSYAVHKRRRLVFVREFKRLSG